MRGWVTELRKDLSAGLEKTISASFARSISPSGVQHGFPEVVDDIAPGWFAFTHHLAREEVAAEDVGALLRQHVCNAALAAGDPPGQRHNEQPDHSFLREKAAGYIAGSTPSDATRNIIPGFPPSI